MLTTIPFSGFYNSMHNAAIDHALENMLSDSSGCHPASKRISNETYRHTQTPMNEYTSEYVRIFVQHLNKESGLNISLAWESVSSPRTYNFETDRIFARVTESDARAMLRAVDPAKMDAVTKAEFTSRDGFCSHYSPRWRDWGPVLEWDHNQIGALLSALVAQYMEEGWEFGIAQTISEFRNIDDWVYENLDKEGQRLVIIAGYLRRREERDYRSVRMAL